MTGKTPRKTHVDRVRKDSITIQVTHQTAEAILKANKLLSDVLENGLLGSDNELNSLAGKIKRILENMPKPGKFSMDIPAIEAQIKKLDIKSLRQAPYMLAVATVFQFENGLPKDGEKINIQHKQDLERIKDKGIQSAKDMKAFLEKVLEPAIDKQPKKMC